MLYTWTRHRDYLLRQELVVWRAVIYLSFELHHGVFVGPIPHISSLIHERMRPFNPKKVIRLRKNRNKIIFQWCDSELDDEVTLTEHCFTQFESLMRGSAVLLSQ